MATIATLNVLLTATTDPFGKGINKGIRWIDAFEAKIKKTLGITDTFGGSLKGVAGQLIALGAAAKLTSSVVGVLTTSFKEIDTIVDTADRIGVGTEALVGLHHAATMVGADVGTLDKALGLLSRRVGDDKNRGSFASIGLDIKKLQALRPEESFRQIADAISGIPNPTEQSAAAFRIFGRQGTELLGVLREGRAGLDAYQKEADELGLTFSKIDASGVKKLDDEINRVKASIKGVGNQMVLTFGPALADTLSEALKGFQEFRDDIEVGWLKFLRGMAARRGDTAGVSSITEQIRAIIGDTAKPPTVDASAAIENQMPSWYGDFITEPRRPKLKPLPREKSELGKLMDSMRQDQAFAGLTPGEVDIFKAFEAGGTVEEFTKALELFDQIQAAAKPDETVKAEFADIPNLGRELQLAAFGKKDPKELQKEANKHLKSIDLKLDKLAPPMIFEFGPGGASR